MAVACTGVTEVGATVTFGAVLTTGAAERVTADVVAMLASAFWGGGLKLSWLMGLDTPVAVDGAFPAAAFEDAGPDNDA